MKSDRTEAYDKKQFTGILLTMNIFGKHRISVEAATISVEAIDIRLHQSNHICIEINIKIIFNNRKNCRFEIKYYFRVEEV